jgi:succinyl-CoA synthetase beta subunit
MNIHEHQAKELLASNNVNVAKGFPAFSVDEAIQVAKKLGGPIWVVKAQIHAGGRGKAGGVKVVNSLNNVEIAAKEILGKTLVTPQTGSEGKVVKRLYIEEGCDIKRELYLSVLVDRNLGCITFIGSTEGGMDIEKVAEETPEKILKLSVSPSTGFQDFHARRLASALGITGKSIRYATIFLRNIYNTFIANDASLIEINPLVVTNSDELIALDAKMSFDDNALFRHPKVINMRDPSEEDPLELKASEFDLSYIKLDGNIGCMVNGAGLAMATMDIIQLEGGSPANFLDVGGGATKEKVTEAFKIILSDPNVKGVLVNIFGGIMRCDVIAEGVIAAAKELKIKVPLVVRLEGTKVEEGKKLMSESGIDIITAENLSDAAKKIVSSVMKEL